MEQKIQLHRPERRRFIQGGVAATVMLSAGALVNPSEAWALEVKALKASTAKTLIQLTRDIYPHDRIANQYYAVTVKGFDAKAAKDAAFKDMLEKGVADLDAAAQKAHGKNYVDVGWEIQRNRILQTIENSSFFQAIRGDLVVSLYNQKEVWSVLGYEGESASKGGYLKRGFDDLKWL